jgi:hypothetical protein
MKTLPLLLALAIACAHADALFTDPVASKNGLAWLNTETRAATTLTLTRNPDGGETIAVIPSGGTVGVLFVDDGGHFLVKTPFGITGWAQARAGEDSGETFPALKHRHDERLGLDLHYHPELGSPLNKHYYYDEIEPDTPAPGLPQESALDDRPPVYEIYDRLLDTAFVRGGARYHMDCTVSLSGQHYCIFLPVREGKIRRTGVAALPGQTFYLPGNGHIYSDVDDSGVRYYRLRQKWALENGEMREIEQPYHYLGLASHYRGILKADDGTHDSKTPLRLLDRVDGKKTVAKIAAGDAVRILLADPHQPCAKEAQLANGSICTDLWLLIQSKDGKTGWVKINYQRDTPDFEGLHGLAG